MAEIKRVRWTIQALRDLDHAYEFIAEDRPSAAHGMIERLERCLEALIHYPFIGKTGRIAGTRELYIAGTPFILVYGIKRDQLEILGFMRVSRCWPDSFPG
jgi:toxin ParE1/3/4